MGYDPKKDKPYTERKQQLWIDYKRGRLNRPLQKWEKQHIRRWRKKAEGRKRQQIPRWKREAPTWEGQKEHFGKKPEKQKAITPKQALAIEQIKQIKTLKDYSRLKQRIDPEQTYRVPVSYFIPEGKGYQDVKGSQIRNLLDKERMEYLRQEIQTGKKIKRLPQGTKIIKTDEGYTIKLTEKGAEQLSTQMMEKEFEKLPEAYGIAGKWAATTIWGTTSPEFWRRVLFEGGESGKQYVMSQTHGAYQAFVQKDVGAFATRIALSPLAIDVITFGAMSLVGKSLKVMKPIGTLLPRTTKVAKYGLIGTVATAEGTRITGQFMKSPERGAFAALETGKRFYFAYKGLKWGLQAKPISLKPITDKIDFGKVPIVKQMKSFMNYRADIRMAKSIREVGHHLYQPTASYLHGYAYGANRFSSTVQQVQGTLMRSGYRGAYPLGTPAWAYYHSINVEPILAPRAFSGFKILRTGELIKTYNIFGKTPQLAMGVMPKEFTTSQIAIKVTGLKKTPVSFEKIGFGTKDTFLTPIKPSKGISDIGYRYVTVQKIPDIKLSFKHKFQYPKIKTEPVLPKEQLITLWREPGGATPIQTRFAIPPVVFTLKELEWLEGGIDYGKGIAIHEQRDRMRIGELGGYKPITISERELGNIDALESDVGLMQGQILTSALASLPISLQISGQVQQQLQLQRFKYPSFRLLTPEKPITRIDVPSSPPPTQLPPPPTPIPILGFGDELFKRKRKGMKGIKPLIFAYHEREHKFPKIDELFKGGLKITNLKL